MLPRCNELMFSPHWPLLVGVILTLSRHSSSLLSLGQTRVWVVVEQVELVAPQQMYMDEVLIFQGQQVLNLFQKKNKYFFFWVFHLFCWLVFALFEVRSCSVAQAGLRLVILLLQPLEFCDFRCMLSCLALFGLFS